MHVKYLTYVQKKIYILFLKFKHQATRQYAFYHVSLYAGFSDNFSRDKLIWIIIIILPLKYLYLYAKMLKFIRRYKISYNVEFISIK